MSSDRKATLVGLSVQLIAERGFDSFSFADLAERSGLAKPSIHHHFPTKGHLALAVLDAIDAKFNGFAQQCVQAHGAQALPHFVMGMAQQDWGARICPLASMLAEYNVMPPDVQTRLSAVAAREVQTLSDMLQAYAALPGHHLSVPLETAARLLISAAKGTLIYGRAAKQAWMAETAGQMVDLLVRQG